MSRTKHHKNQKNTHSGHDFGGKYKCNSKYNQQYGVDGRDLADRERRNDSKRIIREELKNG